MVGWGLTVPSTVQLDRKGEESCRKGGGGHEERDDKPDSGLFPFFSLPQLLDAWLSCLPHNAFVLLFHFFSEETHLNLLAGNWGRFSLSFSKNTFFYCVVQAIFDLTWLASGMTHEIGFGQFCS